MEQQKNNQVTTTQQPGNTNKNEKNVKNEKNKESVEYKLSEYLFNKILEHNPEYKKPNLFSWSKHIDLMIRIDKRTPDKIREVIDWCQADDFWCKNILSTNKLRKQYDKLVITINTTKPKPKPKVLYENISETNN